MYLNFILETAHFGANVVCVRKISSMPKSEGECSLIPLESATGYKSAADLSTSGFVKYSIKSCNRVFVLKMLGWRSPSTCLLGMF